MSNESLQCAQGRRTGLFTSPHLAAPTERIALDSRPISPARFSDAFDRVHLAVEELLAADAIDLHTTYFETVTAMALLVFAEEQVDLAVLEVGLGGTTGASFATAAGFSGPFSGCVLVGGVLSAAVLLAAGSGSLAGAAPSASF